MLDPINTVRDVFGIVTIGLGSLPGTDIPDASGFSSRDIADLIDYVCKVALRQEIFFLWRPLLKDPKDDMVAEAAVTARCRAIVTHNVRDFVGVHHLGVAAITPASFLRQLRGLK